MHEIKRVLKPGGLCFISIPLDSPWQEKIVNMNRRFKKVLNINEDFNEHIQFFPAKKVDAFLRDSGLEMVSSVRIGFKFPFRKMAFRVFGGERISRLDGWLSQKIPIGALGYKDISIGNEFLVFSCRQV
jgi:SAM-dependent methyltransferase